MDFFVFLCIFCISLILSKSRQASHPVLFRKGMIAAFAEDAPDDYKADCLLLQVFKVIRGSDHLNSFHPDDVVVIMNHRKHQFIGRHVMLMRKLDGDIWKTVTNKGRTLKVAEKNIRHEDFYHVLCANERTGTIDMLRDIPEQSLDLVDVNFLDYRISESAVEKRSNIYVKEFEEEYEEFIEKSMNNTEIVKTVISESESQSGTVIIFDCHSVSCPADVTFGVLASPNTPIEEGSGDQSWDIVLPLPPSQEGYEHHRHAMNTILRFQDAIIIQPDEYETKIFRRAKWGRQTSSVNDDPSNIRSETKDKTEL